MVGRHELDALAAQQSLAVKVAAIGEHQREAVVVLRRARESATAREVAIVRIGREAKH